MIDRELIYTALFTRLSAMGAFRTVARRPLAPGELLPENQPALFAEEVAELAEPRPRGLPTRWLLSVNLGVYYHQESQHWTPEQADQTPATSLNLLIAAVETALAPDPATGVQTLGGAVSHCWIQGVVVKSPAYLQAQGAAVIPVRILAA